MILVVEDNCDVAGATARGLARRGFDVEIAGDGEAAYKMLAETKYECMVLDMGLPKINGAELLMLMQFEKVDVPVIVITGFNDFAEDELKEFANVKRLVAKPFAIDDLAEAINECSVQSA
jgi:DNA-binding response OmpR family regulator